VRHFVQRELTPVEARMTARLATYLLETYVPREERMKLRVMCPWLAEPEFCSNRGANDAPESETET
jgi:hypothetical protein